jgi:hypothetical protein
MSTAFGSSIVGLTLALSAGACAAQTVAQLQLAPAQPRAGETVYAVYTSSQPCQSQVDPAPPAIRMDQGVIAIGLRLRSDFLQTGCDNEVRMALELGQFPAGSYAVVASFDSLPNPPYTVPVQSTRAEVSFVVQPRIGVNRPVNNVSGMWYSSADPGWALTLYQQGDLRLLGSWATYDAAGVPTWFFLLPGQWTGQGLYEAPIAVAANGPYFGRPSIVSTPPMSPTVQVVGSAKLLFGSSAPLEAGGVFTYVISGATYVRTIGKFRY